MFFEIFDDPAEAVTRKEAVIYCSDNLRFFRDNFGTAVYTSAVSEKMFVMEGDVSLFTLALIFSDSLCATLP